MTRPTLLLTRPEAASRRFAAAFAARFGTGIPVLVAPLMALRPCPLDQAPEAEAAILTSEAGATALAAASDWRAPAFCVGARTAAAARTAGFPVAAVAADAAALLPLLRGAAPRHLLHARGRHAAFDFKGVLDPEGFTVAEAVIYDQPALPLSPAARALLDRPAPVLLPVFSPRSARLFAEAAGQPTAPLCVAAMSPAVTAALPLAPAALETAPQPDAEGMLAALGRLLAAGDAGATPAG